jgi:hypothetical protein
MSFPKPNIRACHHHIATHYTSHNINQTLKRTHKFKYNKMSATHPKGRLDPDSVLDDYSPTAAHHFQAYNAHAVADVTSSGGASFPIYKPRTHVNAFVGGYSSLPVASLNPPSHIVTSTMLPPPANATVAEPLNMTLQNTIVSQRMMVKHCVKNKLFRRLKFFKKDVHGLYDLRHGTVCAMIVANCNVTNDEASEHWWADMRKLVVCTHTDRRNNVIKNMHLRFKGNDSMLVMFVMHMCSR